MRLPSFWRDLPGLSSRAFHLGHTRCWLFVGRSGRTPIADLYSGGSRVSSVGAVLVHERASFSLDQILPHNSEHINNR